MQIAEVYRKYKHFDELLSDKAWLPTNFTGFILRDLWQAIKADVKESKPTIFKTTGKVIDGDDMHWSAECPNCENSMEFIGCFDPAEKEECPNCHCIFVVTRIYFENGSYIK